ncbi:hypothetical protein AB0D10_40020 [Kitasatospora sp. NPDC048545]|uniref:hypothetical protein n=1 Tax=Kitasatospora sp. NPDC048545 TaxID=3157208 RepID=UPI0033D5772F
MAWSSKSAFVRRTVVGAAALVSAIAVGAGGLGDLTGSGHGKAGLVTNFGAIAGAGDSAGPDDAIWGSTRY